MKPTKTGMKTKLQALLFSLLSIALLGLLSACAPAPPKPQIFDIQVSAATDVNPDMQGRPSPIILHILELGSTEQFNGLDYTGLTQPSGSALGAELLSKKQMVLQPGESKTIATELNPLTTTIGLVAGYRDIDNAVWRKSAPVTPGKTKSITITLEQQQIVTTVTD